MDNSTIPDYNLAHLPECYAGEHSPANDPHMRAVESLKTDIVLLSRDMRPAHVEACKLKHRGVKSADIAARLDLTIHTVYRVTRTPIARELLALLAHLDLLSDGVTSALRKNVLWRIAARNEIKDPRVAISALSELNKMAFNEELILNGNAGNKPIEIIINNQTLPRGVLDV